MTSVVVDANLAVALAVPLPYSHAARDKFKEWGVAGVDLLAPALWGYEVTSALRKSIRLGRMDSAAAKRGLEEILELAVEEVAATRELHLKALDWAERFGATVAYDAAYIALAEDRGVELWTADRPLVGAAKALKIDWVRAVSIDTE